MFGHVHGDPAGREDPLYPRSPFTGWQALCPLDDGQLPRELRISAPAASVNHESPLRGLEFVTRKITDGRGQDQLASSTVSSWGNLDARRDWVTQRSTSKACTACCRRRNPRPSCCQRPHRDGARLRHHGLPRAGIEVDWRGEGLPETAVDVASGRAVVRINSKFYGGEVTC